MSSKVPYCGRSAVRVCATTALRSPPPQAWLWPGKLRLTKMRPSRRPCASVHGELSTPGSNCGEQNRGEAGARQGPEQGPTQPEGLSDQTSESPHPTAIPHRHRTQEERAPGGYLLMDNGSWARWAPLCGDKDSHSTASPKLEMWTPVRSPGPGRGMEGQSGDIRLLHSELLWAGNVPFLHRMQLVLPSAFQRR